MNQAAANAAARARRRPAPLTLRPLQRDGVNFMREHGYRVLVADAPGTGKTIQTLVAIAEARQRLTPALIVCPASVAINWRREARKWLPRVRGTSVAGRDWTVPGGHNDIIVCPWDLLADHAAKFIDMGLGLVVLDEAHYARNPETLRGGAAELLCKRSPHVLLLSGTPLVNTVEELDVLRRLIGTKRPPVLRRLLEDVAPDVPPKTRIHVRVPIPTAMRTEYERIEHDFSHYLEDYLRAASSTADAAELRRTRALTAEALVQVGYLRRLLGRAKAPAAAAFCARLLQSGEPVVLFAEHMEVLDAISEALTKVGIEYVRVDGSVSRKLRQQAIDDFQGGKVSVFMATQAAREGITLTRARNVCFVERWWHPASEEQAEDRARRIGQRFATRIWFLEVADTFDQRSSEIVEAKRKLVAQHVGSREVRTIDGTDMLKSWLRGQDDLDNFAMPTFPELPSRYQTHQIRFAAKNWLPEDAARWAKMHGFKCASIESAPAETVLNIRPGAGFQPGTFKQLRLGPDIRAIVGQPRRIRVIVSGRRRRPKVRSLTGRTRR